MVTVDYILLDLPEQSLAMVYWGLIALISLGIIYIFRKFYSEKYSKYNDIDLFCYVFGSLLILRGMVYHALLALLIGALLIIPTYLLRRTKIKISKWVRWCVIAIPFLIVGLIFKNIAIVGEGIFFAIVSALTYGKKNLDLKKTIVVFSLIAICLGYAGYYGSNQKLNNSPIMLAGTSISELNSAESKNTLKFNIKKSSIVVLTKKGSKLITYYGGKKENTYLSDGCNHLNLNKPGKWKIVNKVGTKSVSMPIYISQTKKQREKWLEKIRKDNYKKDVRARLKLEGLNDKGKYQVQKDDKNEWGIIKISGTTNPNAHVSINFNHGNEEGNCVADSKGHFSYTLELRNNDVSYYDNSIKIETITSDQKKMNKQTVKVVDPDNININASDDDDSSTDDEEDDSSFMDDSEDSSSSYDYSSHSSNHISQDDKLWLITTAKEYLKHDYENVKMPWGISDYTYSKEPGDTYIISGEFKSNGQIHDFEMLIYMDDDKTEVLTANVE